MKRGYCPAWAAISITSLALLCVTCSTGLRRGGLPAAAQTAIDTAIDDIDAGRYEKLYEEASDEWRSHSSLEQSKATFETLRAKLGRARTRSVQTAREDQTSTGPVPGHSVTVVYQTSFDGGQGMETVTLIKNGGRWALAKYYVSSSGLK